jgi:hypothetical protein
MGDPDVEKDYLARKKKLRELHAKLSNPQAKKNQEIYHRIMGSAESEDVDTSKSK